MRNNINIKKYPAPKKYENIHIIINPASGKNEPILNTMNEVFSKYNKNWTVDITKKFGDATKMAQEAAKKADIVVSYGGDGTLHEIINGVMNTNTPIGVLPGGTGNGFAAGLLLPDTLKESLELICTSQSITKVDVVKLDDTYFVSRMYVGIDPEQQTSRESKDKYGVFAYAVDGIKRAKTLEPVDYTITIDGQVISEKAVKCYVVNSGSTGVNVSIGNFDPTDGILDIFTLGKDLDTLEAALERFAGMHTKKASQHYWQGKNVKIETNPSQAVWADGEYIGRTPVSMEILSSAVSIVVPDDVS